MKLAQALSDRADLQRRIQQMSARLTLNAIVQEGEKPAEDPEDLLKELESLFEQLEVLMTRINHTNSKTMIHDKTLTELLARRDCLTQKISILHQFMEAASSTVTRGMRTEIRNLSTVSVKDLRKQTDDLSKKLRELDGIIQEVNWTTELQ